MTPGFRLHGLQSFRLQAAVAALIFATENHVDGFGLLKATNASILGANA